VENAELFRDSLATFFNALSYEVSIMAYSQVTPEIIALLEKIAPGRVVSGDNINPDYSRDEMPFYGTRMPAVSIDVLSTEEISEIMKICYANSIPVTTRGAGTGLAGGAVPIFGGVVLCTARMNKIISFDLEHFGVVTQPGVLIQDLKAAALEHGLFYPPDPAQPLGSIGGNVSTNAGGMRAIKYGVTRDYVRGMTVVMPDGEIIKLGANVAKTSTGYNMTQLITGSEGTLGIISELVLKLIKAPKFDVSVLVPFRELDIALKCVPKIFANNFRPTAVEFFEKDMLLMTEKYLNKELLAKEINGTPVDAYLLLMFDGDSMDEIEPHLERLSEFILAEGALDVLVADTPSKTNRIWDLYGALMPAMLATYRLFDENDVVVPINRIAEYIQFMSEDAKKYDFEILYLGHAGDGNVHIFGVSNTMEDEEFKRQIHLWMVAMYDKAKEMGGQLSGEHGIGFGKIDYFRDFIGARNVELHKGIKKVFDPKLILNPGKVAFKFDELV
jgi:glycolate oxidase